MKEKRNLFERIFGKKDTNERIPLYSFKLLNGYDAIYTKWGKNPYDSKVARTAIDRIATQAAKMTPKHIQNDINHPILGDINKMLQGKPNPIMTSYDFIYKIVSQLYTYDNAFVFIAKNERGYITGFYPVLATETKLLKDDENNIYLRFKFIDGNYYTLRYEEVIHLRRFYNSDDFWGESNSILDTDLETAHISSEGIKHAIKMSNSIKGILKYSNSMIKNEDIVKNRNEFVNAFIGDGTGNGIAALDSKATFEPINVNPITLDDKQLDRVNKNIYDFFGISENIIRNDYSSEQWNAFYEGVIEPLSVQFEEAFTNAIFSEQAIRDGHRIIFTTHRLQYASLDQKIKLLNTILPYGLVTKDTALELLDMHPIGGEEGAKILQSLNNIDSSIANSYQGGGNSGKES